MWKMKKILARWAMLTNRKSSSGHTPIICTKRYAKNVEEEKKTGWSQLNGK